MLHFQINKVHKPKRAPRPVTIYTVTLWVVVIVLILMLGTICVVQTLDAQRAHVTAAAYQARNQELQGNVEELSGEVEDLQEQNEKLQKQGAGITAMDQLDEATFSYQTKYPAMYVEQQPLFQPIDTGAVYFTFDDGPSQNTEAILDALKAAGAHATFFVVGGNIKGYEGLLKRMVEEGHTIGIHSYTHNYKNVYASVDAYLEDFNRTYEAIYEACGVYPTIFRFPGGSINGHSLEIYQPLIAELLRRGFIYYDWSVDSRDEYQVNYAAREKIQITDQLVRQFADKVAADTGGSNHPIVLLHDASKYTLTAKALPRILQGVKQQGYVCEALTNAVRPTVFTYTDW